MGRVWNADRQTRLQQGKETVQKGRQECSGKGGYSDRKAEGQVGMQADRNVVVRGDRQTVVKGARKITRQTMVEGVRKVNRLEDRNVVGSGGMRTGRQ